jgi:diguanylate cyclase (GGDEF)-like protein
MKIKNSVISKLAVIPSYLMVLTLLVYIIPLIFDEASGENELIWFIYIIPAFIFSYYWGLWGGITAAVTSSVIQISWEIPLSHFYSEDYNQENYILIIANLIISFGIAFGIGLLADKLKKHQKIIEKINLELQNKNKLLVEISLKDELTGLWNRRGLLKLALNGVKQHQSFSVLYIDLDKFKPVNDTYGHHFGDLLLQKVANRLINCVPEKSIISRIGGDEFAILLYNADEAYSVKIAKKIINDLSKKFLIDGKESFITPSIGISFSTAFESNIELLIQNADIAMYFVKRNGKNDFMVFDQSMKKFTENRVHLENQLHKALEQGDFILYYQPKVDLKTKKIYALEALIRWNHPELGLVSPNDFIPIAEETGLIIPIGKWVLQEVCKQNRTWQTNGISIKIAINVATQQFKDSKFIETLMKTLDTYQLSPESLSIEITESSIMENINQATSIINELDNIGIEVSMDDFGTGYSSLSLLTKLPFNVVKIDKSFVNEIMENSPTASLVKTMISMSENLNFALVAEGIESEEQERFLIQNGCQYGQGYFYSPPIPAKEIEKLLINQIEDTERKPSLG